MMTIFGKDSRVVSTIFNKNLVERYLILTIALIISAISYNLFLRPSHIVTGGTSGIAIITEFLFNINSSIMIFILDFFFLVFSYVFLGKHETIAALYILILYPLLVSAFSFLTNAIVINNTNILVVSLYAGVFSGLASGLIYKAGFNTGGVGVISKILHKKYKMSLSSINLFISLVIVLTGTYVFGINMLLYACVVIMITKIISERVLLGVSRNKVVFVVTEKHAEISDFIIGSLHHDVTMYDTVGRFSSVSSMLIMTVIPTSEYYVLKNAILEFDNSAFVFVTESYEVNKQDMMMGSSKEIINFK